MNTPNNQAQLSRVKNLAENEGSSTSSNFKSSRSNSTPLELSISNSLASREDKTNFNQILEKIPESKKLEFLKNFNEVLKNQFQGGLQDKKQEIISDILRSIAHPETIIQNKASCPMRARQVDMVINTPDRYIYLLKELYVNGGTELQVAGKGYRFELGQDLIQSADSRANGYLKRQSLNDYLFQSAAMKFGRFGYDPKGGVDYKDDTYSGDFKDENGKNIKSKFLSSGQHNSVIDFTTEGLTGEIFKTVHILDSGITSNKLFNSVSSANLESGTSVSIQWGPGLIHNIYLDKGALEKALKTGRVEFQNGVGITEAGQMAAFSGPQSRKFEGPGRESLSLAEFKELLVLGVIKSSNSNDAGADISKDKGLLLDTGATSMTERARFDAGVGYNGFDFEAVKNSNYFEEQKKKELLIIEDEEDV